MTKLMWIVHLRYKYYLTDWFLEMQTYVIDYSLNMLPNMARTIKIWKVLFWRLDSRFQILTLVVPY